MCALVNGMGPVLSKGENARDQLNGIIVVATRRWRINKL